MKKIIKNLLYKLLPKINGLNKVTILNGPAKGVKILLDIRLGGSYLIGTYDKWIFDRVKLHEVIKPGMVCWDCGAFYGYYGAIFRNYTGDSGFVEIFEASSKNYKSVSYLPQLNNWNNVRVHNYAVGPENSEIKFVNNLGGSNGPLELDKKFESNINIEYEVVKCYGVDELIERMNIKEPDLIKFDLETAEVYALKNGDKLFSNKKPIILLELHGATALKAACDFIEKYNYQCKLVWDMNIENSETYHSKNNLCSKLSDNYVPHMLYLYP